MQMRILMNNGIFVDRLFIDRFYYSISTSILARLHIYIYKTAYNYTSYSHVVRKYSPTYLRYLSKL